MAELLRDVQQRYALRQQKAGVGVAKVVQAEGWKTRILKDKYGRTIADVLLPDGTNVNHQLVKDGWCWWYRKYAPGNTVLQKLEKEAREAKKGLWADPSPVPPWVYRKATRGQSLDLSDRE